MAFGGRRALPATIDDGASGQAGNANDER